MNFASEEALAAYFWKNPGLKVLELDNNPTLTSLPQLPSSLTYLRVYNNPALTSLPQLPSSLTYLRVANCPGLTSNNLRVGKLTICIR